MTAETRVVCVGEALIDWLSLERGRTLADATAFVCSPGGAPLNTAIGLARLGVGVAFRGCVGDDPFGSSLRALAAAEGVDVAGMRAVPGRATRMAYVVTTATGDRQLAAFLPGAPAAVGGTAPSAADAALEAADLADAVPGRFGAMIFGALALLEPGPRQAILAAAARVRAGGGIVAFDPNVRDVLWPDRAKRDDVIGQALAVTTLLKLGADEWDHVAAFGADPGALATRFKSLAAVVVTAGAAGATVYLGDRQFHAPTPAVDVVEATGAGDAFLAALIAGLVAGPPPAQADWSTLLADACAAGALACTRPGAIAALPTRLALAAFREAGGG